MFGYVRPYKPELLVRQWEYYRSAYCGLCKMIGSKYGQIPRLALTYDMTFLVVLLNSLSQVGAHEKKGICLLNPAKARLIMKANRPLEFAAATTVLLAHYKGIDDRQDGKKIRGNAVVLSFAAAKRKVLRDFTDLDTAVSESLEKLAEAEKSNSAYTAASIFGDILAEIFCSGIEFIGIASNLESVSEHHALFDTVRCLGHDLGRWIYLIDAIDDYKDDMDNGEWNPFAGDSIDDARKQADGILAELELSLDKTAVLLPYVRDSALIANVVRQGLPYVRARIIAGVGLEKL